MWAHFSAVIDAKDPRNHIMFVISYLTEFWTSPFISVFSSFFVESKTYNSNWKILWKYAELNKYLWMSKESKSVAKEKERNR